MGIVIIMGLFAGLGTKEALSGNSGPTRALVSGFTHPPRRGKLARRPIFVCRKRWRRMSGPDLANHSYPGDLLVAAQQLLDLIGNTPLVEITRMDAASCRLFLKLESQNPGGSIKDRIGRSMIDAAEREGKLKPGGTLIEATAGNTGLGLALVATLKGYKLVLVVPDKMSREKIFHLKAMGAEVILTRSDVGKGHAE